MKHAKEPWSINSLCGKPVKPYGKAHGRVQAIPAHLCENVSQAKPKARENKREWCGKCLAGMGLKPLKAHVKTVEDAFGDLGPPYAEALPTNAEAFPTNTEVPPTSDVCPQCGGPKAHPAQVYCGAGCAARAGA